MPHFVFHVEIHPIFGFGSAGMDAHSRADCTSRSATSIQRNFSRSS